MAAALAVASSACGKPDPVADEPSNIVGNVDVETLPGDESAGTPPNAPAPPEAPTSSTAIPAALHGRWGIAPADCTSTYGDAKGLMTVSADELRFYESVARPTSDVTTLPDAVSGNFTFTGEGQTWTRHEALTVRQGKLVRTESDPMSSYTYARCR
jgi:hypothetical protein